MKGLDTSTGSKMDFFKLEHRYGKAFCGSSSGLHCLLRPVCQNTYDN